MPYAFPPDLQKQISERLASGRYASEDDVVREAFDALNWEEQELGAILAAVDALEKGDAGVPLDTAFDELRRKYAPQSNE